MSVRLSVCVMLVLSPLVSVWLTQPVGFTSSIGRRRRCRRRRRRSSVGRSTSSWLKLDVVFVVRSGFSFAARPVSSLKVLPNSGTMAAATAATAAPAPQAKLFQFLCANPMDFSYTICNLLVDCPRRVALLRQPPSPICVAFVYIYMCMCL